MDFKPLNLRLEKELIAQIKIRAIQEERTVSEITAELYRKYLSQEKKGTKEKTK